MNGYYDTLRFLLTVMVIFFVLKLFFMRILYKVPRF